MYSPIHFKTEILTQIITSKVSFSLFFQFEELFYLITREFENYRKIKKDQEKLLIFSLSKDTVCNAMWVLQSFSVIFFNLLRLLSGRVDGPLPKKHKLEKSVVLQLLRLSALHRLRLFAMLFKFSPFSLTFVC